jgi:hypothetical protein
LLLLLCSQLAHLALPNSCPSWTKDSAQNVLAQTILLFYFITTMVP